MGNKLAEDARLFLTGARIGSLVNASPEYARALLEGLEEWAAKVRSSLPAIDQAFAKTITTLDDLNPKYEAFYRHERPEQVYAVCGNEYCTGKSEFETPEADDLCEDCFLEFARQQVRDGQSVSGSIWKKGE